MADTSTSNSVAAVAIVILVIAALAGGYLFMRDAGDSNDIHIEVPGGKH